MIDKDLSAALLALELGADGLLLLTDVDGIQLDYGTPAALTGTAGTLVRAEQAPVA